MLEGLVHDVRAVVADRAARQLDAVADDVVLEGLDRQRIAASPAPRSPPCGIENGLWLNSILLGLLVQLVHREVRRSSRTGTRSSRCRSELLAEPDADAAGQLVGRRLACRTTKNTASPSPAPVARGEPGRAGPRRGTCAIGPLAPAVGQDDVAEARRALLARPLPELVEEAARLRRRPGRPHRPHHRARRDRRRRTTAKPEPRKTSVTSAITSGIAQIRLVAAVLRHRLVVRDARERRRRHRGAVGELLEDAVQHRLDRREDVVLRDEGHLEVELVELAGRAVGAGVLVAEAGRDLEVAVEAGHHQELLELLRRLRQRVELAGVHAARHQVVARALRRARGQDRRLELGEARLDHPAADAGDDAAAQHDVAVQPLAPQVEEAVAQARVLGDLGVAR